MSNRCLGVLALTMIVPLTARAQDVTTLERRLTQLDALRHNAQAAAVRAESTSRESFDTIGAGSLRVVARLADAELIHRAAGIAWPRLDTLYGTAAAALAADPVLFFLQGHPINDSRQAIAHLQHISAPENATAVDVAFQLVRAASAQLAAHADTALTNWLGPAPPRARPRTPRGPRSLPPRAAAPPASRAPPGPRREGRAGAPRLRPPPRVE